MGERNERVRVLYSFPNKLGADRICYTAWQQVNGLAAAGADLLVFPGVLHRPVPMGVKVHPTLARGKVRISYKLVGTFAPVPGTTGLFRNDSRKWWGKSISFTLGRWERSKRLRRLPGWASPLYWKDPMPIHASPWRWCNRNAIAWG